MFTSTWMIVTEKNKKFSDYLPHFRNVDLIVEPECYEVPPGMRSLDHLAGVKYKHLLRYSIHNTVPCIKNYHVETNGSCKFRR